MAMKMQKIGFVKKKQQHQKIAHIVDYLENNLTDDLSIPALAKRFYMSPDYLMHLFKSETGMTAGSYITARRLQKARRLMQEGTGFDRALLRMWIYQLFDLLSSLEKTLPYVAERGPHRKGRSLR